MPVAENSPLELIPKPVDSPELVLEMVEQIRKDLAEKPYLAFDTEFIRENTFYPIVEILQIGTHAHAWVVDVQPFRHGLPPGPKGGFRPGLEPLFALLQDPTILKIAHAVQGDQECLYTAFGFVALPVIDTAVMGSLTGHGDNVGLGRLVKAILGVDLEKGHARTNWAVRPLPEPMIRYALSDVEFLVAMTERLLPELEAQGRREWALEQSAKLSAASQFEPDPDQLVLKLSRGGAVDAKTFGVLTELVRWREQRVRAVNVPRRWLADDSVLVDLARVRPKTLEHLASFRGLSKGEVKSQGELLLRLIARGERGEVENPISAPRRERAIVPSAEEAQALELVKVYLGILAERHKVAVRHLSTAAQLAPVLRLRIETPDDFVRHKILSREACRLIGNELLTFIRGRSALRVSGQSVEQVDLPG